MKTTQMYVEQIIIGLLVLIAIWFFVVPIFSTDCLSRDLFLNINVNLEGATLIVITAYLLGMIYDRVADTILNETDRHNRLRFALFPAAKAVKKYGEVPKFEADPFNETALRIKTLNNSEASDYIDYLRSRMRLMRALCTLVPLYTVIASLYLVTDFRVPLNNRPLWIASGIAILVVYGMVLILEIVSRSEGWQLPPKTSDVEGVNKYATTHIEKKKVGANGGVKGIIRWHMADCYRDPAWSGFVIVIATSVWILVMGNSLMHYWPVPLIGILLTFLVGWVWLRVSKTFMLFILSFSLYSGERKKGADSI